MLRVACLPGDGIGPEVTAVAIEVLRALPIEIEVEEHSFGGGAILAEGTPLPERTLAACQAADAVILGAVGLPELEGAPVRPEQGLIGLRKALDVYANLRPATGDGIDLLIVRELVGGLYYGASGRRPDGSAFDTCEYTPEAIERIARRAFELAGARRAHVTSVDKVNVLETSRLWRETVVRVAADYPDVELEHMLVDTAGMKLVQSPQQFDVILTENTFGDILSDVAAGMCGGLGLAASASLGDGRPASSSRCTAPLPTSPGRESPIRRRCSARWRCCSAMPPTSRSSPTALERAVDDALVRRRRSTPVAARRPRSSPRPCCRIVESPADARRSGQAGTHGRTIWASEQRRERRPDELDAELAECLRQRRDRVVGRWAARRRGQLAGRCRPTERPERFFDPTGRVEVQQPRNRRPHREPMLDAARQADDGARRRLDPVEAELERDLALEHVIGLVLARVDVERRLGARPHPHLAEARTPPPVCSEVTCQTISAPVNHSAGAACLGESMIVMCVSCSI